MKWFWSVFKVFLTLGLVAFGVGVYMVYDLVEGPAPSGLGKRATAVRNLSLPPSRSFRMAFQFQPPAWSPTAFQQTYDFVAAHGDTISQFLDDGVPWVEALAGEAYDSEYEEYIQKRAAARLPGQGLILGVNPVGSNRKTLAPYMGKGGAQDLPPEWAGRPMDHPEVILAYGNYLRRLIEIFQPDRLLYALEVNSNFSGPKDPDFPPLLRFLEETYRGLRRDFPDLPLVIEISLGDQEYMEPRQEVTRALLAFSDMVAVSTYPYVFDSVVRNGGVPRDWFQKVHRLAPEKPFAISETAFLGANFTHPTKGLAIPFKTDRILIFGNEEAQARYLLFLLEEAQRLDAQWVSWWVWRDLDDLWEWIQKGEPQGMLADPMAAQWNHTGLQDRYGQPRTGLWIWDAWHRLPIERR